MEGKLNILFSVSSERSKKDQLPRKQKQDFDFVGKLLDVLEETPAFSEDFSESGLRLEAEDEKVEEESDRSRENGAPSSESKAPVCEDTNPSVKVRFCLPRFKAGWSSLYLAGQETYAEKYCYTR